MIRVRETLNEVVERQGGSRGVGEELRCSGGSGEGGSRCGEELVGGVAGCVSRASMNRNE
jgi:hypothetical protein